MNLVSTFPYNADSNSLKFLPIPPEPYNYTVRDSPLRILVSNYRSFVPLEDAMNIFRDVAFEVLLNMQFDPNWVTRPVAGRYRRAVGSSVFSVWPRGMRNQDLGLLAAQLLLWEEFFGCFVECDMVFIGRQTDGQSWPIGAGSLRTDRAVDE